MSVFSVVKYGLHSLALVTTTLAPTRALAQAFM